VLRRRRSRDPLAEVDPTRLGPSWRRSVEDALAARQQFARVVATVRGGPVRARLDELAARVDAGVLASWQTALRGEQSEAVLAALGPEEVTARLKEAKRRLDSSGGDERVQAEVDALAAQHASVHKLWDGVHEAADRLRLLEVRLGAAVARAATLAATAVGTSDLDDADAELSAVVDELESLRGALESMR
jgi:hypothetical protein